MMVRALQKWLGVSADGYIGPGTIKALQRRFGVTADGYLGKGTAKALQTYLNTL
jgi:murein L,D-transpeptidase YcbB/YkuD